MKFEDLINEYMNQTGAAPANPSQNQNQTNAAPNTGTTVNTPPAANQTSNNQNPDLKVIAQQLSKLDKPEEIEKILLTLVQK